LRLVVGGRYGVGDASDPGPARRNHRGRGRVALTGLFVKLTGFPCHRSDPFVGNETVVFLGSDGSRTTIVTHSANWIGMAAARRAPLGQCRQVAPFEAELPVASRYVVVINDGRLPGDTRDASGRGVPPHVPTSFLRPDRRLDRRGPAHGRR